MVRPSSRERTKRSSESLWHSYPRLLRFTATRVGLRKELDKENRETLRTRLLGISPPNPGGCDELPDLRCMLRRVTHKSSDDPGVGLAAIAVRLR